MNQPISREKILIQAEQENELSDLKQHADKMLRGFENFNNFSSNRAIWELVQNACDLTSTCEITIDYSGEGLVFSHNGKPFTTKSLISLIKQVSGKYGEESDLPEVGKYGTGFLTTHTFGRKFVINSILEANGVSFEVKNFMIDRSPKEWKSLADNIRIQKNAVYSIIKEGSIVNKQFSETAFSYFPETEQERIYTEASSNDLEDYIPVILTINDRIKKVKIVAKDGSTEVFERTDKQSVSNERGICLYKTYISKNEEQQVIYSIVDEEAAIEIILPINERSELFEFPKRMARLFLYYPLVGSENFGINFLINCKNFLPTEPRSGVYLRSNKDQVQSQEAENRRVIERASLLIFDFLRSNILCVENPLLYARINFKRDSDDSLLNEYFEELQATWTTAFRVLPIVQTTDGLKSAQETIFFSQELLDSKEAFDEIYSLATQFFQNLPTKDYILQWSNHALEWADKDIKFLKHEDLVTAVAKKSIFDFDRNILVGYYKALLREERAQFFSDFTLLPNIDGKFFQLSSLLTPLHLTETLLEVGRVLIPQRIERMVHPEFCFNFHFNNFTRRDFSAAVKESLDEKQVAECVYVPEEMNLGDYTMTGQTEIKKLDQNLFESLITYCKLTSNIHSQSRPSKLVKMICQYYSLDDSLLYLPLLDEQEEDLDIRSSRKILVKVFFNLLHHHSQMWVEENQSLLLAIAECNEDSLKEIYSAAKIYPSQLNVLRQANELKQDIDLAEEIKELYCKITGDDVRKYTTYREFNTFIAEDRFITNKYLTIQIEESLFNTDVNNINEHPFKEDILRIISKLKEKYYRDLFPRLEERKASLMLEVVTNERTKDHIFSIVTLKEEQLKKLGELVQSGDFEAVLAQAQSALQTEAEGRTDFAHKYEIGRNIEHLIREKLSEEMVQRVTFENPKDLQAADIQGGQDIIILMDGQPIYYIEVKSRWVPNNSVSMSKLQLERAVERSDRYALCSVDISRYNGENDRHNLPVEEILPLTRFVNTIGNTIKPLIQENLVAEKSQESSIHLADYRGIVPQSIIQSGSEFHEFVEHLFSIIHDVVSKQS